MKFILLSIIMSCVLVLGTCPRKWYAVVVMVDRLRFVLWTWVVSLMYWFQWLLAIWVEAWFWLGFWNWVELILIWLDFAWFDFAWFDLTWLCLIWLCLLICLLAYLLICLLAYLFTYLLACLLIYLFTYWLILTWWLYLESMMIDLGKSLEIDIIGIESDLIGIIIVVGIDIHWRIS